MKNAPGVAGDTIVRLCPDAPFADGADRRFGRGAATLGTTGARAPQPAGPGRDDGTGAAGLVPAAVPASVGGKRSQDEILALTSLILDRPGRFPICGPGAFYRQCFDVQVPTWVHVYNNRLPGDRRIGAAALTLTKAADERLGGTEEFQSEEGLMGSTHRVCGRGWMPSTTGRGLTACREPTNGFAGNLLLAEAARPSSSLRTYAAATRNHAAHRRPAQAPERVAAIAQPVAAGAKAVEGVGQRDAAERESERHQAHPRLARAATSDGVRR